MQIAYRVEISADGLVGAIASGRLRNKLNLSEMERSELMKRGTAIEQELRLGIVAAYEKEESDLLNELAPEQRAAVRDLIGKVFMFNNYISGMKAAVASVKGQATVK
jgi:hypothetical protein